MDGPHGSALGDMTLSPAGDVIVSDAAGGGVYRLSAGAKTLQRLDNGDFVFLDCAYEELLQSLGPINDTSSVPWTMFNDNVSMGFFDVYDQYILNLLYDPRIKAGMTVEEVKAVLPEVLADVRVWIRKVNNLAE